MIGMDCLISNSTKLMDQMNTYEAIVLLMAQIDEYMAKCLSSIAAHSNAINMPIMLKLSVAKSILYMYDKYRLLKWQDILETATVLLQLAENNGYSHLVAPNVEDIFLQEPTAVAGQFEDVFVQTLLRSDITDYRQD